MLVSIGHVVPCGAFEITLGLTTGGKSGDGGIGECIEIAVGIKILLVQALSIGISSEREIAIAE